jgi:hypothetical protein
VRVDFGGILRPYQRLGDDVDEQVQRWGKLGLSLRRMQSELSHLHLGPLALTTLTDRLHRLKALNPTRDPKDVPPILSVDAIWATQLRPNGHYKLDRKGRRRAIKGRATRPIFIAMGVWPDEDRCEIVDWQLGENEEAEAWITFLTSLEEHGIRGSNGLRARNPCVQSYTSAELNFNRKRYTTQDRRARRSVFFVLCVPFVLVRLRLPTQFRVTKLRKPRPSAASSPTQCLSNRSCRWCCRRAHDSGM